MCPTSQIGTEQVVGFLEDLFARDRWGLPSTIGTDNEPQFSSAQFETFLQDKGIRHVRTAYYHPQSNGGVEMFNQVLKQGFRAYLAENVSFPEALRKILMNYRATPHALTRMSPAELMIRRQLRLPVLLHVLQPPSGDCRNKVDIECRIAEEQDKNQGES